jgi:hypothetical protein
VISDYTVHEWRQIMDAIPIGSKWESIFFQIERSLNLATRPRVFIVFRYPGQLSMVDRVASTLICPASMDGR